MKTDKVLVTGSKGFVGKNLCRHLVEVGNSIISSSNNGNNLDVTNMNQLQSIEEVQAIIHLAAKVGVTYSIDNAHMTYYTNLLGTLNLLEFARLRNVRRFIFVSTYVMGNQNIYQSMRNILLIHILLTIKVNCLLNNYVKIIHMTSGLILLRFVHFIYMVPNLALIHLSLLPFDKLTKMERYY